MTYIRTISESAATGELAERYHRLAYRDGTVDAAFKALSLSAALLGFAEKPPREPSAIRPADVERLRRAGLDDRAILDACNVVAYFDDANRVTLKLGIDADPGGSDERPEHGPPRAIA